MAAPQEKKSLAQKLFLTYRLVILNDQTFEEKVSFTLNRLNVFIMSILIGVFLILGTTLLIALTPLREFIPGYSNSALIRQANELSTEVDSLQTVLLLNEQYYASIKKVLTGEVATVNFNRDSMLEAARRDPELVDLTLSAADSALRDEVAREDKYSVDPSARSQATFSVSAPVKGVISEGFNPSEKHYAVDIVVTQNTPVKATSDGVVIYNGWDAASGNVIILEHSYGLISVYKHNSRITKRQGDQVRAGEVIAMAGSTGTTSTGPHVHFELWNDGYPVDPIKYIDFN